MIQKGVPKIKKQVWRLVEVAIIFFASLRSREKKKQKIRA
jgi:hypothetical protein